mmetsp:Transcript_15191/g.22081  ORF Transcript_15191/g.22081 Transcript_15191/m.22081 type:complete len:128 (-) Transcript_15191:844-1227(-)
MCRLEVFLPPCKQPTVKKYQRYPIQMYLGRATSPRNRSERYRLQQMLLKIGLFRRNMCDQLQKKYALSPDAISRRALGCASMYIATKEAIELDPCQQKNTYSALQKKVHTLTFLGLSSNISCRRAHA